MATTAKVYLSDGLPIEVKNAYRVSYFPDGSAHIFDKQGRAVFIGAPGRFVCVVIEYALNEEATEEQISNMPIRRPANAIVPVQPQGEKNSYGANEPGNPHPGTFHGGQICATCRNQEKRPVPPPGFPPVGDSKSAPEPEPGEVKVTSTGEREPDGETTHEIKFPVRKVKHEDFLVAPLSEKAGRQ